jgi:hypothetical protein
MSRPLTNPLKTVITSGRMYPVVFVEIEFADQTLYLWSGIGTKSWNGQSWAGVGYLGSISPISEGTDIQAYGITLSLSGIPTSMLTEVLTYARQGKAVKVWFGALDDTGAVVADPFQSFAGRLDVPTIDEGAEAASISITAESCLVDLNRSHERRYTHEDQQIDYPGDLGFIFVPSLQEWNGIWGAGQGVGGGNGRVHPGGGGINPGGVSGGGPTLGIPPLLQS